MKQPPPPQHDAFAITAPGLEMITARELHALGAGEARALEGGVSFRASPHLLYSANLRLRTASRVVVRASAFEATAFHELERRAKKVRWDELIAPNQRVSLRVTCRKSKLYHSDAVAERVAGAISASVKGARVVDDAGDESEGEEQLILVRLLHDRCTISVDSSGALLHRRGYRQAVAKAPMRETLAAAMLLASGWDGSVPLLDPMCGSGTIAIEGALIARRIAPGLERRFAFERWPGFDAATWKEIVTGARAEVLAKSPVVIQASDRDAGAIEAARSNAERAGVGADIEFAVRPISSITPPHDAGLVATNPPYGVRVGDADRVRNLYAQFGKVIAEKCPGWSVSMASADAKLERQTGIGFKPLLHTSNGGIRIRIVSGAIREPRGG
jgi:putative N6-adenine-specific DNA methylase